MARARRRALVATVPVAIALATTLGAALAAVPPAEAPLDHPRIASDPPFATSGVCVQCHSNARGADAMRDPRGVGVSPFDLQGVSMMANAARDPVWRAAVSAEVAATPSRRAEIEAKCLRCHAPALAHGPVGQARAPRLADLSVTDDAIEVSAVGLDGVTCTVCHGISSEALGDPSTFDGRPRFDDTGRLFGPHRNPFPMPMVRHTGYTPSFGGHVTRSALCGTCHTLRTEALDADGRATGHVLEEQSPYLEWRNSVFSTERDEPAADARECVSCHAPVTTDDGERIETAIARNPHGFDFGFARPRQPYGRHLFRGANAAMLELIADHDATLRPIGTRSGLLRAAESTRASLRRSAAELAFGEVGRRGRRIELPIHVRNLAGHKLPTAHPSRRAWLRIMVTDGQGEELWSSGRVDRSGRLLGANGQPLPSELVSGPVWPHVDVADDPDRPVVYQSVMEDARGRPTWRLLRGARYRLDDRLLPRGWSPDHPEARRTAPVGVSSDPSFGPGEDIVTLRFEAPVDRGPFRVDVALLYQSLGARYRAELEAVDTPETRRFAAMWRETAPPPALLAEAAVTVD